MTAVAFGGTTSENKLWTPTFVLLFFVNLLSSLAFYLLMVVIAEYALNAYGVSLALAGMAVSVFVVGGLVSRFAFGGQIDRLGCKKSLVIGLAVYTGASMLYFFDFGIAWLLFVRFLHGIGFGIASGSAAAAAALIVPVSRKGEGLGYFSMSQALSTAIGPFFAMLVMGASGGYTELFVITAGATGLALVLSFFVKIPAALIDRLKKEGARSAADKRASGIGRFVLLPAIGIAAVTFLCLFCYSGVLSYLKLFAVERGLSDVAGCYFLVYAAFVLLGRPFVGRRFDRKGENSVMFLTMAAIVVGFVVLALSNNAVTLLLSAALLGFGIGCSMSSLQSICVKMAKPTEMGLASSTFHRVRCGVGRRPYRHRVLRAVPRLLRRVSLHCCMRAPHYGLVLSRSWAKSVAKHRQPCEVYARRPCVAPVHVACVNSACFITLLC